MMNNISILILSIALIIHGITIIGIKDTNKNHMEYTHIRLEIQKRRADKIEKFLERKYKGEYKSEATH